MTKNVAICFYGITRSLTYTMASIEANVIRPTRQQSDVRVYAHFFLQRQVENLRSGESGAFDVEEHRLLPTDWLQMEEPDLCLEARGFPALKTYGDAWDNDFRSLRNLVHQLHSMDAATTAALDGGAEVCLFCRPDLRYHDSLGPALRRALHAKNLAQLPYWQPWTGYNDRFALCSGRDAIAAYGQRIRVAAQYCRDTASPLHSERLVRYALERAGVPTRQISARASRVRLDGVERYEDFWPPALGAVKRQVMPVISATASRLHIRGILKRLSGRS